MTARTGAGIEGPFHRGELEAQELAGGGPPGAGIRDWMTEQHRTFFEGLPYVVLASLDDGWPAATVLAGVPGFISTPDPNTLRVAARLDPSDPAQRALRPGAPAGVLGIDLSTKRRNRENGFVTVADGKGFTLDVRQSFGNCPQYIHVREIETIPTEAAPAENLTQLDDDARAQIEAADTLFVGSAARTSEVNGGVDISHRGGPRGFVRVHGSTLTIPDYRGNRYFNTLGNFVSNPRAALLFVDFAAGDLLHLQGAVEIIWDGPEVQKFPAAQRLWRVHVERVFRRKGALPLRWTFPRGK
jgi:predicted pyridoxine 5'-phosphate oxidase superfamily flavin-nucleotide-binding protein